MEIFKLIPAVKETIWGGSRLKEEYGKLTDVYPLGETWECSVHPNGASVIANGSFAKKTLAEMLELHPEYLGTKNAAGFPILVKFIDANRDLSVQVHPDNEYARVHEAQNGKTEMWYVMDASEDAWLVHGFEHPVTKDILRRAIEQGDLDKHLHKVRVRKGDVYFIPPGTVHAIGAGILIAEIQQSSDVTYRLYDYNRVDKDGQKRQLHFDKAADVLNMQSSHKTRQAPRLVHYLPNCSREVLCSCKYFFTEKIITRHGFSFCVHDESFQVILCLDGGGTLEMCVTDARPLHFRKGDCIFLPAGAGYCCLFGKAALLKIRC